MWTEWNMWSCFRVSSHLPPFSASLYTRSRQRPSSNRQAGGGDKTHPEGTAIPCRPSFDHWAHKGTTPARCLLETSKWWVKENCYLKPTFFAMFIKKNWGQIALRTGCVKYIPAPDIVYFPSSKPFLVRCPLEWETLPHTSYTPACDKNKCTHRGSMWYFQLLIVVAYSKRGTG